MADVFTQNFTYIILSTWQVFLALSTGSQLLMVPEATKASPSSLSEVLFQRQYTSVLQLTPALFYRFGEGVIRRVLGDDTRLRVLAFGGEVCPSAEKLSEWKSAEVRPPGGSYTLFLHLKGISGLPTYFDQVYLGK